MLECINKECVDCKEGKCQDKEVISGELGCCNNIKPTHTPTYAEEQLEHAKEKENRCYNESCQHNVVNRCKIAETNNLICKSYLKEPINYEEEYHKLKKENEELNRENMELQENSLKYYNELKDIKHIYYNSETSEVKEENRQLKERNKSLEEKVNEQEERIEIQKSTIVELKEQIGKILSAGDTKIKELNNELLSERDSLKLKASVTEKLEIEINNLNEIIERKDKELDGERKGNTFLENENKILLDRINKYQDSILNKQNKIEELKDQLENELGRNRILKEKLQEKPTIINNWESENNSLRCQCEEAKRYIEIKETEMQKLRKKLEDAELLGKMIKKLVEGV